MTELRQMTERWKWIGRTTRREGFQGRDGRTGPLRSVLSSPYIAQNAYFYVYVHPSRFRSIERTSKDNYRTWLILEAKPSPRRSSFCPKIVNSDSFWHLEKTETCWSGTKWITLSKTTSCVIACTFPRNKCFQQSMRTRSKSRLELAIGPLARDRNRPFVRRKKQRKWSRSRGRRSCSAGLSFV